MMHKYQSESLLNKYKAGACTDEERAIVESWHIHDLEHSDFMPDSEELERAGKAIWAALPIHEAEPKHKTIPLWFKYSIAASIALITAIGGAYFFNPQSGKPIESQTMRFKNDVSPGGNKAMLTLADGTIISLDDAASGKLARQSGIEIQKTADGQLVYNVTQNSVPDKSIEYNTVSTPRGGKYQVNLPDGTKVWLNAESKLKFPSSFAQLKDRKVELSGEAYFEVKKDKVRPFIVASDKQQVTVLGTHFNINAYPNAALNKTTLLEGSVKLTKNSNDYPLKPGQQAVVGAAVKVIEVDTEEVIAWKDGNFIFMDSDINSIMDILKRWYDIDVVYEGTNTTIGFNAEISRDKSLIQVLKALEKTGNVKFKIDGRRVIVM